MISNKVFRRLLHSWSEENPRFYPWINEKDPYKIWISEILLQQTRSEQAQFYYTAFIKAFPSIDKLAFADEDQLMTHWKGLGYYNRARNLHKTAKIIVHDFQTNFPNKPEIIQKLPGIGPYTTAAISSFAFGLALPVIDGNVIRVYSRISGLEVSPYSKHGKKTIKELAEYYMDASQPALYNQAIMNFGAIHCKPVKPNCSECPFKKHCFAYINNFTDSIPLAKERRELKKRHFHYFILRNNKNAVALKKRQNKDIWPALYEFPMIENNIDRLSKLEKEFFESEYYLNPKSSTRFTALFSSINKLSHQEIHCFFYELGYKTLNTQIKHHFSFEKPENLANFAFPSPIQKFIKHYF